MTVTRDWFVEYNGTYHAVKEQILYVDTNQKVILTLWTTEWEYLAKVMAASLKTAYENGRSEGAQAVKRNYKIA